MQEQGDLILPANIEVAPRDYRIANPGRLQIMPDEGTLRLQCYGLVSNQQRRDTLEIARKRYPGHTIEIDDLEADVDLGIGAARELLTNGGIVWGDGRKYDIDEAPEHLSSEPWIIEEGSINDIYAVVIPKPTGSQLTFFYSEFPFDANNSLKLFSEYGFGKSSFPRKRLLAYLDCTIREEHKRKSFFKSSSSRETLLRLVLGEIIPPQNILIDKSYLNRG